jgi:nitroimidazol reductase NimA-like FMN-containing flavoprotein (pyridoxamine 5'-phosphate oxidase superfamily)
MTRRLPDLICISGRDPGSAYGIAGFYGKGVMDERIRARILELLEQHRLMTVATNRPDGWPQATTVGYVNDGLTIYFLCSPQSQKAQNLARDNRISLTIDHDTSDPMAISGLSMAAQAQPVTDPAEITKALKLLGTRYPEYAALPMPKPEEILVFRAVPKVISVLDYTQGFGHTDFVMV